MKKILLTSMMLAGAFATLSAQQSKTSESTAGIFGNDVDDYMGVNSWGGVNPEKMFGFLGVGGSASYGVGTYDIGFAKKFGDIYWGTYFGGDIGIYTRTKTKPSSGDSETESHSSQNDATIYQFDNIIGIGNMGFKLDFEYFNADSEYSDAGGVENSQNNAAWNLGAEFGINLESGGKALKPHFGIAYGHNWADSDGNGLPDGKKVVTAGVEQDLTLSTLALAGGIDIDFEKKGNIQHSLSFNAGFETWIEGDDMPDMKHSELGLSPEYKATFEISDDLKVGAKVGLPLGFVFGDTFTFAVGPEVSTGISYKAKEKLTLNAGIDFALITGTWTSTDDDATDTKTKTFTIDGNDGYVSLHSGFNYAFSEKFSLDFTYNILDAVFGNDFRSDFDGSTTSDAFWGNINTIFRPQLGFLAIIKL